jgi:hypothetical protein
VSRSKRLAAAVVAAIAMSISLCGCDQLRSHVSDFISPEKPDEALKSAESYLAEGRYKEAREKAQLHADKVGPLQPQFALIVAKASAHLGDSEAALKYLSKAVMPLKLTADALMADSAFTSLHTDVRFLQLITFQTTDSPAPSRDVSIHSGGDAQISINSGTTEVKAGDVVIKIPN